MRDSAVSLFISVIAVIGLLSCEENSTCYDQKKLTRKELTTWLSFDGNLDSVSEKQIVLDFIDVQQFTENSMVRVSLDSKYVFWGRLSSSISVSLPKESASIDNHLVGIEVIDPDDSKYYGWFSDDVFYLSRNKKNYVKFLCGGEDETITLNISQ